MSFPASPRPSLPFPIDTIYLILKSLAITTQEILMLFSIGNLITLVIVLLFFFVYHRLTANNRSLEKVKRLAEKLQSELNDYVVSRPKNSNITASISTSSRKPPR